MLISVLLPVYNGADFLSEAVGSILAQDIEFELIISDDASDDGTLELLNTFRDRRIKIINNDLNVGIFGNINRCINVATGKFLQVFSQDDIMNEGYLSSQMSILEKHPAAGLVYGQPTYIDESGTVCSSGFVDTTPEFITKSVYIWISSHYGALPSSISSVMIRKTVVDKVGAFDPNFYAAGDVEFYNRVSEIYPIIYNREKLHMVRSHQGMTTVRPGTGQKYLSEEFLLDDWCRKNWSKEDYMQIRYFRTVMRGRYHLGWIKRLMIERQFKQALQALRKLNKIYPLRLVVGWHLMRRLGLRSKLRPTVPPPLS